MVLGKVVKWNKNHYFFNQQAEQSLKRINNALYLWPRWDPLISWVAFLSRWNGARLKTEQSYTVSFSLWSLKNICKDWIFFILFMDSFRNSPKKFYPSLNFISGNSSGSPQRVKTSLLFMSRARSFGAAHSPGSALRTPSLRWCSHLTNKCILSVGNVTSWALCTYQPQE